MQKINKGQSNLALGGTAARHRPVRLRAGEPGPLTNTVLIDITRMSLQNDISFRPTALAGCARHTYR